MKVSEENSGWLVFVMPDYLHEGYRPRGGIACVEVFLTLRIDRPNTETRVIIYFTWAFFFKDSVVSCGLFCCSSKVSYQSA